MNKSEHSPEQLHAMRHSLAHIMATAVTKLWPEARLGVGPVVTRSPNPLPRRVTVRAAPASALVNTTLEAVNTSGVICAAVAVVALTSQGGGPASVAPGVRTVAALIVGAMSVTV